MHEAKWRVSSNANFTGLTITTINSLNTELNKSKINTTTKQDTSLMRTKQSYNLQIINDHLTTL